MMNPSGDEFDSLVRRARERDRDAQRGGYEDDVFDGNPWPADEVPRLDVDAQTRMLATVGVSDPDLEHHAAARPWLGYALVGAASAALTLGLARSQPAEPADGPAPTRISAPSDVGFSVELSGGRARTLGVAVPTKAKAYAPQDVFRVVARPNSALEQVVMLSIWATPRDGGASVWLPAVATSNANGMIDLRRSVRDVLPLAAGPWTLDFRIGSAEACSGETPQDACVRITHEVRLVPEF